MNFETFEIEGYKSSFLNFATVVKMALQLTSTTKSAPSMLHRPVHLPQTVGITEQVEERLVKELLNRVRVPVSEVLPDGQKIC